MGAALRTPKPLRIEIPRDITVLETADRWQKIEIAARELFALALEVETKRGAARKLFKELAAGRVGEGRSPGPTNRRLAALLLRLYDGAAQMIRDGVMDRDLPAKIESLPADIAHRLGRRRGHRLYGASEDAIEVKLRRLLKNREARRRAAAEASAAAEAKWKRAARFPQDGAPRTILGDSLGCDK